jgi:TolB-like protein
VISRVEFETAVKDALRHYARPDLLFGNRLLQADVLQRRSAAATVQDLRTMLAATAGTLFANARDQKLHRVLELTYFDPAPKQETAADRLGLPFSTYRRHLTTGVGRIVDWLWQQEQQSLLQERPARETDVAKESGRDAEPHRLSIVVLPFLNLSQDPAADYLVCGIVDSLITDLTRTLPGSFVVSRSTAFSYQSRQVPVRQIGRELQVQYALEGSAQVEPDRIRINAQLIDAQADEHLWAERFDTERRTTLEVQDEIVARLARAIGVEMVRNAAARIRTRGANAGDARDLAMQGTAVATDLSRSTAAVEAIALFRQALALDPDNVDAMVGIASTRIYQMVNQFQTSEREALLQEAQSLTLRAAALAPDHIGVRKSRAVLLRAGGQFAEAIVAAKAVIALNPGEPTAYRELGLNHLYLGETSEAVDWFRRADRIAPQDRARWTWLQGLGRALMQLGEDAEALRAMRLALQSNINLGRDRAYLAAAEMLAGEEAQAKLQLAKLNELDPGLTIRRFVEERSSVPLAAVSPIYLRENERILAALRNAGMPDQQGRITGTS